MLFLKKFRRKGKPSEWHNPTSKSGAFILKAWFPVLFFLMTLFSFVPFTGMSCIPLNFPLILIYHWAIYRSIPIGLLLFNGAFQDLFLGLPLGVHIVENIIFYKVIRDLRKFLMTQNFSTLWGLFGFFLSLDGFLKEMLSYWLNRQLIPVSLVGWSTIFTFLVYPICVKLFIFSHKKLDPYLYE